MKKTFYVFELPSFLFFIVLMMTTTGRYDNHNAQILSYVKELKEGNISVRREINYGSYSQMLPISGCFFLIVIKLFKNLNTLSKQMKKLNAFELVFVLYESYAFYFHLKFKINDEAD